MNLNELKGVDLKPFEALLKLCRKQGVSKITLGDVVIDFGDLPKKNTKSEADDADEVPTDELTPEQLMFFSAGGAP